jgi:hypothetical protein
MLRTVANYAVQPLLASWHVAELTAGQAYQHTAVQI